MRAEPALLAISDLHVEVAENRQFVERIRPEHEGDWLALCGDVGEVMSDIEWGLSTLARRFARVIWVPGNHELWTRSDDPIQLRGEERYEHLVAFCRERRIATPEDPFPVWRGAEGDVAVAPLFTLYDYSFCRNLATRPRLALEDAGVVCTDEFVLSSAPYSSVEEWCHERVRLTEQRLERETAGLCTVLINHFALVRELTRPLRFPEFARWCGTVLTGDWHERFRAIAVVYGHLHIPRTTVYQGVPFLEVSLGYPRQWRHAGAPSLRVVLPLGAYDGHDTGASE